MTRATAAGTENLIPTPPSRNAIALRMLRHAGFVLLCGLPAIVFLMAFVDRPMAQFYNEIHGGPTYRFFDVVEELGVASWYIVPGVVAAIGFALARSSFWKVPAYIAMSVASSSIAANIVKMILGRHRPKHLIEAGDYGFAFFETRASMMSFPSGHTTTAFAAAVALGILLPKYRTLWWTAACFAAAGRVVTGAHYPSDIVAGAWLGTVTSLVLADYFVDQSANRLLT